MGPECFPCTQLHCTLPIQGGFGANGAKLLLMRYLGCMTSGPRFAKYSCRSTGRDSSRRLAAFRNRVAKGCAWSELRAGPRGEPWMPGNRMFRTPRRVAGKHSPSGKECRWHDDTRLGSVKPILERRETVATTMKMEFPPVDWGKGTNPSPFIHDSPRGPRQRPAGSRLSAVASCAQTALSSPSCGAEKFGRTT